MIQLSKHLKAVNQGDNDSIVYTGSDGSTKTVLFNGDGIYINGTNVTALSGTAPTHTDRTNSAIVDANTPNANIDLLDAAIGGDPTPVSRTTGPITAANTLGANIDALDAAIGADHTPLTRTVGLTAVGNAVNANIDALDTVIGADSEMWQDNTALLRVVDTGKTIYANLDELNDHKTVKTIKVRVGAQSLANCDLNFASAGNMDEQVLTLLTLPSKAKLLEIMTYTSAVFTNAVTLTVELGTTSSGHELMNGTAIVDAATLLQIAADHMAAANTITDATKPIYAAFNPGANWSAFSAGSVDFYITYVDVSKL